MNNPNDLLQTTKMSTQTNILITGATGYIGGSVLKRFLEHPNFPNFYITALVRSADKAARLKTFGIDVVVGSHSDLPLLEKLASEADVVLSVADADDLPVAQATLRGLKKRYDITKSTPIFIHTSGTGVLTDKAGGLFQTDTIYNDQDPDQIETLAPTQPHRNVDLELVNADKQGYVKTYIVIPSTIYGIASGKLVDQGIQNPHSIQIPAIIKASLDRGQGGMVGKGVNYWPNVEIDELADLYITLYNSIVSNPATGHGREGIYFGESGEHTLYDIGKAVGDGLVKLGKATSPEPTTFTKAEIDKYFGGSDYLGSNSRCRANRSRSIGWKPVKTTKDMLESVWPEIQALTGSK